MIPDVNLNTLPPGILAPGEKLDPKALETKIESMFMETMLKSMEETVDSEDGFYGDSASSDIYRGMVREQLASGLTGAAFKNFNLSIASPVPAADPKVISDSNSALPAPVKGVISSPKGWRRDPISGEVKYHKGTDYAAPYGTPVSAVAGGVVIESGPKGTYGNAVVIQTDDGQRMLYGHNEANLVQVGQRVQAGDEIAQVGSTGRATGPHVHFEVLE